MSVIWNFVYCIGQPLMASFGALVTVLLIVDWFDDDDVAAPLRAPAGSSANVRRVADRSERAIYDLREQALNDMFDVARRHRMQRELYDVRDERLRSMGFGIPSDCHTGNSLDR